MHILVIAVSDVSRNTGPGITSLSLARAFAQLGHRVTLVAPGSRHLELPLDAAPARLRLTPSLSRFRLPHNLSLLPQLFAVAFYLLRHKVDLVYIRAAGLTVLAGLIARYLFSRRVVSEHNGLSWLERLESGHRAYLAPVERWLQIWDAKVAHRVRVVMSGIARELIRNGVPQRKVYTVGNATNTDIVRPMDREAALSCYGLDPARRYIGFIGHITAWQGVEVLVDALDRLSATTPEVCLLVAGSGPMREALCSEIEARGLSGHFRYLGIVPYLQIGRVLSCMDIAILTTSGKLYVSMGRSPLKLRDYAASGRVVVATDVPTILDLRSQAWLHMFPAQEPNALARLVERLLKDPKGLQELGIEARRYAERKFAWPVIAQTILEEAFGDEEATNK